MATVKISELTDATVLDGTEELPVVQSGTTKRATVDEVLAVVPAASTTEAGVVELATNAEVTALTDTDRAVTPSGLSAYNSALGTVLAATYQPLDADLTALAAAGNSAVLAAATASFLTTDETKLDGIEALADVTDAANVDAAGATMNADTTLVGNGYFLDEDNMASDSASKVPSQQSVKAYADLKLAKASNLSDVANAATAFGNIKQAASDTATGVVELATSAEVLTGTDTARAVTPAGLSANYLKRNLLPGSVADDTYDGPTATMTAAENLAIGDVCYINSSSKLAKADADAAATAGALFIALATIATDASGSFGLPGGFLRDDSAYAWTAGATLYLSTTAGALTATAPSGAADVVQVMGVAYSADVIFFNPSPILIVVA